MTTISGEGWAKFLEGLPENVAAVARRYPATACYRSRENSGHYQIVSYGETGDVVTVTLAHGRDSFLPGVAVIGASVETLTVCGCGQWREPTRDQLHERHAHIVAHHAARGHCAGCVLGERFPHVAHVCKRGQS